MAEFKVKMVSYKELTEDNPTLCLSVLRQLGECHKCEQYRFAMQHSRFLRCKPKIKPEIEALLQKRLELREQLREVERQIKNI